jgi:hypothetical protein
MPQCPPSSSLLTGQLEEELSSSQKAWEHPVALRLPDTCDPLVTAVPASHPQVSMLLQPCSCALSLLSCLSPTFLLDPLLHCLPTLSPWVPRKTEEQEGSQHWAQVHWEEDYLVFEGTRVHRPGLGHGSWLRSSHLQRTAELAFKAL